MVQPSWDNRFKKIHGVGNKPRTPIGEILKDLLYVPASRKESKAKFLDPTRTIKPQEFLEKGVLPAAYLLNLQWICSWQKRACTQWMTPPPLQSYVPAFEEACACPLALCFNRFCLRRRRLSSSRLLSIFLCLAIYSSLSTQGMPKLWAASLLHRADDGNSQLLSSEISGPCLP